MACPVIEIQGATYSCAPKPSPACACALEIRTEPFDPSKKFAPVIGTPMMTPILVMVLEIKTTNQRQGRPQIIWRQFPSSGGTDRFCHYCTESSGIDTEDGYGAAVRDQTLSQICEREPRRETPTRGPTNVRPTTIKPWTDATDSRHRTTSATPTFIKRATAYN